MTAKQYLGRLEDLWSVYEMAAEKERKMREQVFAFPAIRYDKDRIDHSVDDTMSEQMARLADYSIDARRRLNQYMDAVDDLQRVLMYLDNPDFRLVIWYRYVGSMSIKQISSRMHITSNRVSHIIGDAVGVLNRIIMQKSDTK